MALPGPNTPTDILSRLPEELLLAVAKELMLGNIAQAYKPGICFYKNLPSFCLVNKKCSRVGREVLLRHCCLTNRPVRQPYLLLRTLLRNPELTAKIRHVAIYNDERFDKEEDWPVESIRKIGHYNCEPLTAEEQQGILPATTKFIDELPLPDDLKAYWSRRLVLFQPWAAIVLLLFMAQNVHILYMCDDSASFRCIDFLKRVAEHYPCQLLRSLRKLGLLTGLQASSRVLNWLGGKSWLQLPLLENVTISTYKEKPIAPEYAQQLTELDKDELKQQGNDQEQKDSIVPFTMNQQSLWFLFLHGALQKGPLRRFLSRQKSLQCFSREFCCAGYEVLDELFPLGDRGQEIYEAIQCLKDCLTHLTITHRNYDAIWPINLDQFTALRTLDIGGTFKPDLKLKYGDVEVSNIDTLIDDWLPPNVEKITILPRWPSVADADEPLGNFPELERSFEEFLPQVSVKRPTLKTISFGGYYRMGSKKDWDMVTCRCNTQHPDDY
jgi:hypothetical protein